MLPLILMTLTGYLLNRLKIIDKDFNRQLSRTLINVFYPSLIINLMVKDFTPASLREYWVMPVALIFILTAGWFLGLITLRFLKTQTKETQRCYHFTCLMNNYSFLPIMIAASMWGDKAIALIIFSALGSELTIWTLGIKTLTGQKISVNSLKHLLSMPMVALIIAFAVIFIRAALMKQGIILNEGTTEIAGKLMETSKFLGGATIPVAAIVCGFRMATLKATHIINPLIAGTCLMRLVVIPAFCVAVFWFLPLSIEVKQVLFLIAVQPAAMASVALAEAFNADSEFAATATFATHILCLITIPLWLGVLT